MLDLPAPGHLLHHELGVHPDVDISAGGQVGGGFQPGDEAPVLRDVVGRGAQALVALGEHLPGTGVADHGAVSGRPWITA
jgi:hypothetical protein